MNKKPIRVQVTIHQGELIYPLLENLNEDPAAMRKLLHSILHIGVLASANVSVPFTAGEAKIDGSPKMQKTKKSTAKKSSTKRENSSENSFVIPEIDLGGYH